jgi:alpha-glucosidase
MAGNVAEASVRARFEAWAETETGVRLHGPCFGGRIEVPAEGVFRVLLWHRPQDADKGSWVVEATAPQALQVSEEAGTLELRSGEHELHLQLDPFALEFADVRLPGAALTGGLSSHLTRWWEEDELPEVFADDGRPAGSGMALRLAESASRAYYGLGGRTGWLDRRGRNLEVWATDPAPPFTHDQDPLYQAHPFLMLREAGRFLGLYLDETWRSGFSLAPPGAEESLISSDGPTLDFYLIAGPDPKRVLRRYSELVGRASMPPLWALGYHQCRWGYADAAAVREVAAEHRRRDIPLDAMWLDIDHMERYKSFTFDPHRFPSPAALSADLAEQGVRLVTIIDPGLKAEPGYHAYDQALAGNYAVRAPRGEVLRGTVWPGEVIWPDFTRAEVRQWWGELHRSLTDAGVAGVWNDMNEPSTFTVMGHQTYAKAMPPGARHAAHTHAEVHNLYALLECRGAFEALTAQRPGHRPFVLTRAGFPGIQRYAWVWSGDNSSSWQHLEESIPMLLGLSLSGVPFIGADIGGFSGDTNGELLTRWTWLGVCYPLMRNHSECDSLAQEAWAFGEPWTGYVREAVRLRYRLLPHLYSLAREAVEDGSPPLRPMLFEFPQDSAVWGLADQFMLGADLLAAPALRPGQQARAVYLPAGLWHDFWNGESFEGGRWIVVPTPLDGLPLFVRGGSALALTEPAAHSTSAHWAPLVLRLAPDVDGQVSARLWEDAGDGDAGGAWTQVSGRLGDEGLEVSIEGPAPQTARDIVLELRAPEPRQANCEWSSEGAWLRLRARQDSSAVHISAVFEG